MILHNKTSYKRFIIQHAKLLCSWERTLRVFIYGGMRDRSLRSGTKLAREIQLTDWSTAGNLSNRSSGVQIPRDICTRFGRYLYSAKCSWIIKRCLFVFCEFLYDVRFLENRNNILKENSLKAFLRQSFRVFDFSNLSSDSRYLESVTLNYLSILYYKIGGNPIKQVIILWLHVRKSYLDLIIWEGSFQVNLSVFIGSFLVRISPYEPFSWKRS